MPYFPVDDQFAFHPKAVEAGNSALGAWVRAGAWCKAHASGGFVPVKIAYVVGSRSDVQHLVDAGLWLQVANGFAFHDWQDQAGNFDADSEKEKRESERERNRDRKRRQRERESHAGHAESHGVTPGGVTPGNRLPPSPSPSPTTEQLNESSPVPDRESYPQGTDESESVEAICARQASSLGVDFAKVKTAIGKACGRFPDPTGVMRIIATVLDRATPPVKSPTGIVLTAVRNNWAEWQQFLDEGLAS